MISAATVRTSVDAGPLIAALDCLPDIILVFDPAQALVHWNARLAEALPDLARQLEIGDSRAGVEARLDAMGEAAFTREVRHDAGGFSVITLSRRRRRERSAKPARTTDEAVAIQRAREAAEEANRAKTRFLAAASHDLRQPLQALAMFTAVLSERENSPANKLLITRIEQSVEALDGLLSSLLDMSKLEAGLVTPHIAPFAISGLLARLAEEFRPLAQSAGLDLALVPNHTRILSDQALLERILRNLLANAIRYTPKGRILFGCRRHKGTLCIEVWDTGIGIPRGQTRNIFEEFQQLDNPARDRRKGLGLGLTIADRLAKLLGHTVEVASVEHRGSVFSVTVPIAAGRIAAEVTLPPTVSGMDVPGARVLLIDDEPDVLESTRLLLADWGYDVATATCCEEALARLSSVDAWPDLVVADYRLKDGETGTQAISRIRAHLKTAVPAIILTGDTAPERLRRAQASGHRLLHKPVRPTLLRGIIAELLAPARAVAVCHP